MIPATMNHPDETAQRTETVWSIVERVGYAVFLAPAHEEGAGRPYSHSVGFTKTLNHPEILIFDLGMNEALIAFAQLFEHIKNGARFDKEGIAERSVQSKSAYSVYVLPIADENCRAFLPIAQQTGEPPIKAVQFVLPDASGKFPWQTFEPSTQPLLGTPLKAMN